MKNIQKSLKVFVLSVAMTGAASIPGFADTTCDDHRLSQSQLYAIDIERLGVWEMISNEARPGKPYSSLVSINGVEIASCVTLANDQDHPAKTDTFAFTKTSFGGDPNLAENLCTLHEQQHPQFGPWKF